MEGEPVPNAFYCPRLSVFPLTHLVPRTYILLALMCLLAFSLLCPLLHSLLSFCLLLGIAGGLFIFSLGIVIFEASGSSLHTSV